MFEKPWGDFGSKAYIYNLFFKATEKAISQYQDAIHYYHLCIVVDRICQEIIKINVLTHYFYSSVLKSFLM